MLIPFILTKPLYSAFIDLAVDLLQIKYVKKWIKHRAHNLRSLIRYSYQVAVNEMLIIFPFNAVFQSFSNTIFLIYAQLIN